MHSRDDLSDYPTCSNKFCFKWTLHSYRHDLNEILKMEQSNTMYTLSKQSCKPNKRMPTVSGAWGTIAAPFRYLSSFMKLKVLWKGSSTFLTRYVVHPFYFFMNKDFGNIKNSYTAFTSLD